LVNFSQQALFCVQWFAAAWLKTARRAATHLGSWAGLTLPAVLLIMCRDEVAPWVALGLANLFILGAVTALRRGVVQFARQPPRDTEYALLLIAGAAATAAIWAAERWTLPAIAVLAGSVVWTVARTAIEIFRGLADEFGGRAALWCAMPSGSIAAVFCSHVGMAPLIPGLYSSDIARPACNRAGADEVAQRMLEVVRSQQHPERGSALRVTVSTGIAVREDASEPIPVLQRRLDKVLYSAKAAGRDQTQQAFSEATFA
jgi:hypothetical protein